MRVYPILIIKLCPKNCTKFKGKSARYTIPGLVAHKSAMKGGETMDVPDCGETVVK